MDNFFLSTSHHDTSYQVSSQLAFPFSRRSCKLTGVSVQEKFNIDFQDGGYDFRSERFWQFFIYMLPRYFIPSFESIGLSVHEKFKINFQDGLGFLIEIILAIFDQQACLKLPTKVLVCWRSGSGEKAENRFSRWPPILDF